MYIMKTIVFTYTLKMQTLYFKLIVLHFVVAFIHFFNPQSVDKLLVSKAAGIF